MASQNIHRSIALIRPLRLSFSYKIGFIYNKHVLIYDNDCCGTARAQVCNSTLYSQPANLLIVSKLETICAVWLKYEQVQQEWNCI